MMLLVNIQRVCRPAVITETMILAGALYDLGCPSRIYIKLKFAKISFVQYGSAEGPPRGVENRNLLSHPDDLRMEAYVIRMTYGKYTMSSG